MVFSSLRFFLFLPAMLAVLALPLSRRAKHIALCAGSCFFYAAWDYRYLLLLLLIAGIDFWCAQLIHASDDRRVRRMWLIVSVVTNIGILCYFKYANFFLRTLNGLLEVTGEELPLVAIFLPAGISFYTFKSMSYTIDVYRRVLRPEGSILDYAMFVTFFADLIAGPIVRASVFLPQMKRDPGPSWDRVRAGASLFLVGLAKKRLIADHCAVVSDAVFAAPQSWSTFTAWCGLIAYWLQIYCDFSGYSDMAIGTGKMIGYDLPENFRMPYIAANITDAWRRWHMTLSEWFRDYVFFPLSRKHTVYGSLIVTMLLCGLWHGPSWNFVLWGLLHGSALALHRFYRVVRRKKHMTRWLSQPITTAFVILSFVPFRAGTWKATVAMFAALFGFGSGRNFWAPTVLGGSLIVVIAAHAIGVAIMRGRLDGLLARFDAFQVNDPVSGWYVVFGVRTVAGAALVTTIVLSIYFFAAMESSPFIYFQF